MVSPTHVVQGYQPQFQHNQQSNQNQKGRVPRKNKFDPIPMTYTELYPTLLQNELTKTRSPPAVLNPLPWWYKPEAHCDFHQGAPWHDLETRFSLKV